MHVLTLEYAQPPPPIFHSSVYIQLLHITVPHKLIKSNALNFLRTINSSAALEGLIFTNTFRLKILTRVA